MGEESGLLEKRRNRLNTVAAGDCGPRVALRGFFPSQNNLSVVAYQTSTAHS
jgi:hypothetical protein